MGLRARSGPGAQSDGSDGESATADYGKTASFLAVGVGLTGIITYTYFLIASHVLSKPDYGQITVLWSAVFITISTLYRPIEQLLSRHISERLVKGEPIGQPMRVAATIQFGLSLVLRGHRPGPARADPEQPARGQRNPLLGLLRVGPLLRGQLLRARLPRRQAALRPVRGADPLRIVLPDDVRGAGRGQRAERPVGGRDRDRRRPGAEPDGRPLRLRPPRPAQRSPAAAAARRRRTGGILLRHGGGFAAAVLLIMFSEQAFLNAGPLITRGLQGAAAAGYIFNVLMIARAPLQLFQAISTSILPHLTSLHTSDRGGQRAGILAHGADGACWGSPPSPRWSFVVVVIAGPKLMQIAFSKKFTYDREGLLLVTLGMGLYLCSVTVNQACVAQGQVRRAAARWIGCAALFIAWNFVPLVSNEFRRVEIGFLLAAGSSSGAPLLRLPPPPRARRGRTPGRARPEELEARLAVGRRERLS